MNMQSELEIEYNAATDYNRELAAIEGLDGLNEMLCDAQDEDERYEIILRETGMTRIQWDFQCLQKKHDDVCKEAREYYRELQKLRKFAESVKDGSYQAEKDAEEKAKIERRVLRRARRTARKNNIQALEPGAYCDECGELIDSESAGCQSDQCNIWEGARA